MNSWQIVAIVQAVITLLFTLIFTRVLASLLNLFYHGWNQHLEKFLEAIFPHLCWIAPVLAIGVIIASIVRMFLW